MTADANFQERVSELISEFGKFGLNDKGGIDRLALSENDRKIRNFLCAWLKKNGFEVLVDPVGNIFGVLSLGISKTDANFMCGSHLDSQPNGGLFDGTVGIAYACIGGVALKELINRKKLKSYFKNYIVACWTSEEGARFQPSLLGSKVFTGNISRKDAFDLKDETGMSFKDALLAIGYKGTDTALAPDQYLEVHIEQGQKLENLNYPVGIVSSAWGARKINLKIEGQPDHTGPTPMAQRVNALLGASKLIVKIDEIAQNSGGTIHSSVGRVTLFPNSPNTVVSEANLWIEFRADSENLLKQAEEQLNKFIRQLQGITKCKVSQTDREIRRVIELDQKAIKIVADAFTKQNISFLNMTTIAGHDALQLQSICPATLLFIPSKDGISHSPEEFTSQKDIEYGFSATLCAIKAVTQLFG